MSDTIRMKHADPNAEISLGEKDATGGVAIPLSMVESAQSGGWYICYDDKDDPNKAPAAPSDAKPASDAKVDAALASGTKPDNGNGSDDGTDPNASKPTPRVKLAGG